MNSPALAQQASEASPVSYQRVLEAETELWRELRRLVHGGAKRWCDVGGGAKPTFTLKQIERWGLDYVVLDVSQDELDRAPHGYRKICASILDRDAISALMAREGPFDVVVTRWTAEHIPDPRVFHESIREMLTDEGTAVHFFPTLYSLPFLVNRVLPPGLSESFLFRVCEERSHKYRAYYRWCRGPSARRVARLQQLGYRVRRYVGYFGHDFYRPLGPLHAASTHLSRWLVRHPVPALTSFALVVLERVR